MMSQQQCWSRQDGPFSWVVACAMFLCMFIQGGVCQTAGLFFVIFMEVFDESRGYVALITSVNFGVNCMIGPLSSTIINRWGKRTALNLAGVTACAGLVISAFAQSVLHLILSFGVLTGGGMGLLYIASNAVILDYFDRRQGIAFGVVSAGAGLGVGVFAYLIEFLEWTYGWRGAFLIIAGIALQVCIGGTLVRPRQKRLSNFPEEHADDSKKEMREGNSTVASCQHLFSSSSFLILCCSNFLFSFGNSVFSNHMPAYSVIELKLTSLQMSTLVSIVGLSTCVFRFVQGFLLDLPCVNAQVVYMVSYSGMGVAVGCVPFVRTYIQIAVLSVLFGATYAAYGAALSAITLLYVGTDLFVTGIGYVNLLGGLGMVLGAPVAGWMFDAVQTYPPCFYLGGVSCLLSGAIILFPLCMGKNQQKDAGLAKETVVREPLMDSNRA